MWYIDRWVVVLCSVLMIMLMVGVMCVLICCMYGYVSMVIVWLVGLRIGMVRLVML